MDSLVGVVAGRSQSLLFRHILLFLAVSEPPVFVRDGRDVLLIKGLAEFFHLFDSFLLLLDTRQNFFLIAFAPGVVEKVFISNILHSPGPGTGV